MLSARSLLALVFVGLAIGAGARSIPAYQGGLTDNQHSVAPEEVARTLAANGQAFALPRANGKVKYNVAKDAKRFSLVSGETPVALFKLSDYRAPYELAIRSLCKCLGVAKEFFVPTVLLLDGDFRVTRTLHETDFVAKQASWSRPMNLETIVVIDDAGASERYLLVFTDPRWVGSNVIIINQIHVGALGGARYTSSFPFGKGALKGTLELEVGSKK